MKFDFESGASHLTLARAILFYESGSGIRTEGAYASFHKVIDVGTAAEPKLEILPGSPLSQRAVMQTIGKLAKEYSVSTEILPENVLSCSPMHLMWWVPSDRRAVFFRSEMIGSHSAKVPHPPLVFLVVSGSWYVFAIKRNRRPTDDTELFLAPYFNIFDSNAICTGNTAVPKDILPSATAAWEYAFFNSAFTHPSGSLKRIKGKEGLPGFWKAHLAGENKRFPISKLVSSGKTVGQVMKEASKKMGRSDG